MLLMGHNERKDNFNNMGSCLTYIKTAKVIRVNDCAKKKVILNHSRCINHAVYSKKKKCSPNEKHIFFQINMKKIIFNVI